MLGVSYHASHLSYNLRGSTCQGIQWADCSFSIIREGDHKVHSVHIYMQRNIKCQPRHGELGLGSTSRYGIVVAHLVLAYIDVYYHWQSSAAKERHVRIHQISVTEHCLKDSMILKSRIRKAKHRMSVLWRTSIQITPQYRPQGSSSLPIHHSSTRALNYKLYGDTLSPLPSFEIVSDALQFF